MTTDAINVSESIPSLDEELATQLWEEVQEKLKGQTEEDKPPIASIAHTEDANRHLDAIPSASGDWESETMVSSHDTHLDALPNYLGEYEAKSEVVPIPTAHSMKNEPQKDGANLQAFDVSPCDMHFAFSRFAKSKAGSMAKHCRAVKDGRVLQETQHRAEEFKAGEKETSQGANQHSGVRAKS